MSVGIASLLSSVLMSVMYVLFLRHPREQAETEAGKASIAETVGNVSVLRNVCGNKKELDINEPTNTRMHEKGTTKKRRTNRKNLCPGSADLNGAKASTIVPTTTTSSKEVWYIQIMNDVRNTKFSCIITLKCVLLFVVNTLSYFVAKGIQDWIGKSQFNVVHFIS